MSASCFGLLRRARDDHYWDFATLGEAALILRDWSGAASWYRQAGQIGRGRFGDLQSSRRNARLILQHLELESAIAEAGSVAISLALVFGHRALASRSDGTRSGLLLG